MYPAEMMCVITKDLRMTPASCGRAVEVSTSGGRGAASLVSLLSPVQLRALAARLTPWRTPTGRPAPEFPSILEEQR